jgi:hypothetical protein
MERKALISGFIGAASLTLIHQSLRLFSKNSPKVDLLGSEIIKNVIKKIGLNPPKKNTLYAMSLVGDILFNSIYYSLSSGRKYLAKGVSLGSIAGLGVISIPQLFNYQKKYNAKNLEQKVLAILVYLTGGLTSSLSYNLLRK